MSKIFWFDVETTGLNPNVNGIFEISYIIEIDNKEVFSRALQVRPYDTDVITNDALEKCNKTAEQIKQYEKPEIVFKILLADLDRFCDKYDTNDKFYLGGYNVKFDVDFLRQFFLKNKHMYFGSYFNNRNVDVLIFLNILESLNKIPYLVSHKLIESCNSQSVQLSNAHDSMSDIFATRELYQSLKRFLQ